MARGLDLLSALGEVRPAGDAAAAAALKLVANGALGGALLALRASRQHAADLAVDHGLALDVLERGPLGALVQGKRDRFEPDGGETQPAPADFAIAALAKDLVLLASASPAARPLSDQVHRALASGAVAPDDDIAAITAPAAYSSVDEEPHGLTIAREVMVSDEVLAPLRSYVAGHATGDPEHFRRAFLPTAHVEGLRGGEFVSWPLPDYCALFGGRPAPDEASRRRRIDHVFVEGSVGTATMTLQHGPDSFTDVFLLVRIDETWRIANKAYHRAAELRQESVPQVVGVALAPADLLLLDLIGVLLEGILGLECRAPRCPRRRAAASWRCMSPASARLASSSSSRNLISLNSDDGPFEPDTDRPVAVEAAEVGGLVDVRPGAGELAGDLRHERAGDLLHGARSILISW